MLSQASRDTLRMKAYALSPVIQVGKNGITPALLIQIQRYLKKHKLVKIKLLRSSMEEAGRSDVISRLARQTGAELVHHVGNVVVLYQR